VSLLNYLHALEQYSNANSDNFSFQELTNLIRREYQSEIEEASKQFHEQKKYSALYLPLIFQPGTICIYSQNKIIRGCIVDSTNYQIKSSLFSSSIQFLINFEEIDIINGHYVKCKKKCTISMSNSFFDIVRLPLIPLDFDPEKETTKNLLKQLFTLRYH